MSRVHRRFNESTQASRNKAMAKKHRQIRHRNRGKFKHGRVGVR